MEGRVKKYIPEKGFGFIVSNSHPTDIFFHISEYRSEQTMSDGDKVIFELGIGKNNKPAAKNIRFLERSAPVQSQSRHQSQDQNPYYGKPTSKKEYGGPKSTGTALAGAAIGSLLFGPIGGLIGGVLLSGGFESIEGKKITSTCLRCGGTGNVTTIEENYIGFQCAHCRSFWRKRNKEGLSMSNVMR